MKKQQKLSALKETVTASGIYEAIEALQKNLRKYERSESVLDHRYRVKQAVDTTRRTLLELENQLEELIRQSIQWEAPE